MAFGAMVFNFDAMAIWRSALKG